MNASPDPAIEEFHCGNPRRHGEGSGHFRRMPLLYRDEFVVAVAFVEAFAR
jgi:hypothetical protein